MGNCGIPRATIALQAGVLQVMGLNAGFVIRLGSICFYSGEVFAATL